MYLVHNLISLVVESAAVSALLSIIIFSIMNLYKKNKGEILENKIATFIFVYYLISLLYVTIYREGLFMNVTHTINVIPLKALIQSFQNMLYFDPVGAYVFLFYNIFGNIFWFLPFGYFICYHFPQAKFHRVVLYSFMLSFMIELVQYIGYVGVSDIDDLILNTCGGALGYGIYHLIHRKGAKIDN